MAEKARILLVDDEELNREYMSELLEEQGYAVETAEDGLAALARLRETDFDLLVTDLNMPRLDGLGLLRRVQEEGIAITTLLITAFGSVEAAVEALKLGAADFLEKPARGGLGPRLQLAVEQALGRGRLLRRTRSLEAALESGAEELVGASQAMTLLRSKCRKLGASDKTVLIRGETGTGKELVARAIHRQGPRASRPFVAINCAALHRELLSSELFGHVKGAFSGAVTDRPGKFEAADGGTLFLDEIGEMDLDLQARLLRVLETREFERLGSNTSIKVDLRIVAATNRVLEQEIEAGRFREDLFHRLNIIAVTTTPLREIPEDIPVLAEHFLQADPEGRGLSFTPPALAKLQAHDWPGNIRELRHVVEQAVFYAEGEAIAPEQVLLPATGRAATAFLDGQLTMAEIEREAIERRLKHCGGSRRKAAKSLDIAESTLYKKIKDYGL
ncbi:MAG: sigma-54-dependent Fis family transcriptional regulator [Candidatus Latescibacteria bacterium]|nr:sigma-54-dependent Fis family transcriptional regulator [Candidatus Latescibacterota bacterium]